MSARAYSPKLRDQVAAISAEAFHGVPLAKLGELESAACYLYVDRVMDVTAKYETPAYDAMNPVYTAEIDDIMARVRSCRAALRELERARRTPQSLREDVDALRRRLWHLQVQIGIIAVVGIIVLVSVFSGAWRG